MAVHLSWRPVVIAPCRQILNQVKTNNQVIARQEIVPLCKVDLKYGTARTLIGIVKYINLQYLRKSNATIRTLNYKK
jgi:hypothetical protein